MTLVTADMPIIRQPDTGLSNNNDIRDISAGDRVMHNTPALSAKAQLAQTLETVQKRAKKTANTLKTKAQQAMPSTTASSSSAAPTTSALGFSPLHSREAVEDLGPGPAAVAPLQSDTYERLALMVRTSLMSTWNFTKQQLDMAVRIAWESFQQLRSLFMSSSDAGKIGSSQTTPAGSVWLARLVPSPARTRQLGILALEAALFIVALAIARRMLMTFVFRRGRIFTLLLRTGQINLLFPALRAAISAVIPGLNLFGRNTSIASSAAKLVQKSSDISENVTDTVLERLNQAGALTLGGAATAAVGASKTIGKVHDATDTLAMKLGKKALKLGTPSLTPSMPGMASTFLSATADAMQPTMTSVASKLPAAASMTSGAWMPSAGAITDAARVAVQKASPAILSSMRSQ